MDTDQHVLKVFKEFLKIPTISSDGPSGVYQKAVDFLLNVGKSVGLEKYKIFSFNEGYPILVFTWEGSEPNRKSVLLNCHYDVVPVDKSKWSVDPFAALETPNGNIYGRGSQDMKCVVIQYLAAICRLIKAVNEKKIERPKRTIHLSFLPDEESGGVKAALPFTASQEFKDLNLGVALDEGLANPADAYTIFYGERVPWWVKITSIGPAGHGSRFIPRTAIEKLTEVLNKIYKFRSEQEQKLHHSADEVGCAHAKAKKLGDVISINVTAIKSFVPGHEHHDGFALNVIPTEAIIGMDVRIPPDVPFEEVEKLFKEWTSDEGLSYSWYTKLDQHNISSTSDSDPWWSTIKSTFEHLKKKIEPEIFPAATDSRYFRKAGLPCYGFSPMNNTPILLHDHDEFINSSVFLQGISVYERLIYNLANVTIPDVIHTKSNL
jgi:aminoacylase